MRFSKILKLSAVGLALLLIPRRSSKLSDIEAFNKDEMNNDEMNNNEMNKGEMNKEAPKDDPLEAVKGNDKGVNIDGNNNL